jgi:hypothetical protein
VERYAPVIVQQVLAHPAYDIPVFIDFDGNADPRDNVDHLRTDQPLLAGVYGELTAETADSYYLTYSLYHAKDYDHPIRERVFPGAYHDSDNEGFHIRVDKATLDVVEAETWFHNRFLLCNRTGRSDGSEPVHGKLHVEAETHIVVFAQAQGHGVRCAQSSDLQRLHRNAKILRFRGGEATVPVRPDRSLQVDATYDLKDFADWYRRAVPRPDAHDPPLFDETLRVGTWPDGRSMEIGRFIASREYAVGTWMRPKPMWSWDDGWDDIPAVVWHFFPSRAFESHGGTRLSHAYRRNQPVEQVFGTTADILWPLLEMDAERRPGDKWKPLEERGDKGTRDVYWRLITRVAKDYVNYVFGALG